MLQPLAEARLGVALLRAAGAAAAGPALLRGAVSGQGEGQAGALARGAERGGVRDPRRACRSRRQGVGSTAAPARCVGEDPPRTSVAASASAPDSARAFGPASACAGPAAGAAEHDGEVESARQPERPLSDGHGRAHRRPRRELGAGVAAAGLLPRRLLPGSLVRPPVSPRRARPAAEQREDREQRQAADVLSVRAAHCLSQVAAARRLPTELARQGARLPRRRGRPKRVLRSGPLGPVGVWRRRPRRRRHAPLSSARERGLRVRVRAAPPRADGLPPVQFLCLRLGAAAGR
mmetsp:Transcript_1536/g.4967  ORF Transcript_1536/g.4967 Transcript_1536/m.4967 type:complete len:292 (+) Transcript_1536:903-1778(+)